MSSTEVKVKTKRYTSTNNNPTKVGKYALTLSIVTGIITGGVAVHELSTKPLVVKTSNRDLSKVSFIRTGFDAYNSPTTSRYRMAVVPTMKGAQVDMINKSRHNLAEYKYGNNDEGYNATFDLQMDGDFGEKREVDINPEEFIRVKNRDYKIDHNGTFDV